MTNEWGISPLGAAFLKKQEGFRNKPYWDVRQWSTGYGTRAAGPNDVVDQAEADRRLMNETGNVSNWLKSNITAPLSEQQEDALISFGYNLGTDDLDKLKGDINSGAWDRVGQRMLSFHNAGGVPNEGLKNRRAAEVEMLTGQKPGLAQMLAGTSMQPQSGGPMPAIPAPPSGRYSKIADALLASAAGAKPRGWGDLLNAAGDLALGYSLGDKHDTEEKAYRSKLSEALMGAKDPDALVNTLLSSGDPSLQNAAVNLKVAGMKPQKPEIGRFKVENGAVIDTATGQIVSGEMKPKDDAPSGYRTAPDGSLQFIPGGPADPALKAKSEGDPKITDISALRKEAASGTNVKKFDDAIGSYQSMLVSASSDNATSDLDMIYGLAKIMDPESVVREGEFETVRNSSSIPNQIKGYWEFLLKGKGKLDAATRQEILGIAANRLNAYRGEAVSGMDRYKAIAEKQGIDPSLIVREFPEVPQYQPKKDASPDQIKDKYRQKYGIQP